MTLKTDRRPSSFEELQQPQKKRRRTTSLEDDKNSEKNGSNVRVVARVRPMSSKEQDGREVVTIKAPSSILVDNGAGDFRCYDYDNVFGPESTQTQVYEESGAKQAVCNEILQGFNCTILAYGQTGSGKTFTMGTAACNQAGKPQDMDGIIPRAVYDLFQAAGQDSTKTVVVDMSFLEIYNEEARDLLSDQQIESSNLYIRESPSGGVYVQNLTWNQVSSAHEVANLMNEAAARRVVASTQMNAVSSRSHAICTLRIKVSTTDPDGTSNDTHSKLTLVDLAGSERLKRTGAEGNRLKEGININKGLFVLGQVVSCLSEMGQQSSSSSSHHHVPFRDSKLTRLLQDSLGGNSRTIMVACASPADSNAEESINTLRYASRARNIQNSAVKNIVEAAMPPEVAAALRQENRQLRNRVIQLESHLRGKSNEISMKGRAPGADGQEKVESTSSGGSDLIKGANELEAPPLFPEYETRKPTKSNDFDLITTLRAQISSLQCKVDHLQDQVRFSAQDALDASLQTDKVKLKLEEITAIVKSRGIELSSSLAPESSFSLVETLRQEISEWKEREAEARIDAEVARATAASVIKIGGGDISSVEDFIFKSMDTDDDLGSEERENEEEASLTKELLAVNGNIEKKEEIVKQALIEKQCMEDLRAHFESALQNLHSEVETLSQEREDLLEIVESIPEDKTSTSQMRKRIAQLQKRIDGLQAKASEHKKSLRLREMAEKRVSKLEREIQNDKKRKAELQKRLKEESVERRKEKKSAKMQAARLMKDSQRLKFELQKVKAAAEKQAMVLKRKTTELLNKQKRRNEVEQRKRKRGGNQNEHSASGKVTMKRKTEIMCRLNNEISASTEIAALQEQLIEQEVLLDETLKKMKSATSKKSDIRFLEEEAETRGSIVDQLKANLRTMQESSLTDDARWNDMSQSEMKVAFTSIVEKLVSLQNDSSQNRQGEIIDKAVAAAKSEARKSHEELILKMRLEHSEAMSNLLDSTRMALENGMKQQQISNPSSGMDESLKKYFEGADLAASSIKTEINQVKSDRDGMQNAVEKVAQDIIFNFEASKNKKKSKKKARKRESFEEFILLDESFAIDEVDDGNDSDWSPDDGKKTKKPFVSDQPKSENDMTVHDNKENDAAKSAMSLDSLKVSELKDRLREYGLKLSGKKAELKARLTDYLSVQKTLSDQPHPTPEVPVVARKPLQTIDDNANNLSFMQDNNSFAAKRREKQRNKRKIEMNTAVTSAMIELAKL